MNWTRVVMYSILIICVLGFGYYTLFFGPVVESRGQNAPAPSAPAEPVTNYQPGRISVGCEDAIKTRLKAPATAKFSDFSYDRIEFKSGTWHYVGTVDSENSFGALLRKDFTCKVQDSDGTIEIAFLE